MIQRRAGGGAKRGTNGPENKHDGRRGATRTRTLGGNETRDGAGEPFFALGTLFDVLQGRLGGSTLASLHVFAGLWGT